MRGDTVFMDNLELKYFRERLLKERKKVNNLLDKMKINETINSNSEMASELSFYDNHPSDSASELFDKERGMAFKGNEVALIKKIDDALSSIDDGTYGICKMCGKEIANERLQFIPYTCYCIECQKELNSRKPIELHDRPVEEEVLGKPFGYGFNDLDYNEDTQYDAEDSYQDVERNNKLNNITEYYEKDQGYVEKMDKISNQQYTEQLP